MTILIDHFLSMQESISKSEFKAKALELFRMVETSGQTVIVTDHGKPTIEVKKFCPITRHPLEVLKGTVIEYSSPTEPVGTDDWETLS